MILNNKRQDKRILVLKDSLESIQMQLEKLHSDKGVYEQEKKLLTDNSSRIGEGGGVGIVELTAATFFYSTKIKELNDKLFAMNQEERRLSNLIVQNNAQLTELSGKDKVPTSNILLIVDAPTSSQAKID